MLKNSFHSWADPDSTQSHKFGRSLNCHGQTLIIHPQLPKQSIALMCVNSFCEAETVFLFVLLAANATSWRGCRHWAALLPKSGSHRWKSLPPSWRQPLCTEAEVLFLVVSPILPVPVLCCFLEMGLFCCKKSE